MRKIFFALMLAGIVVLSSCMNKEQKQRIEKIDSLEVVLDSVSERLNTVDSAQIQANYNAILKYNTYLDSVPEENEDQELIREYRNAERNLRKYLANADNLHSELELSYNQLDSLSYDVKHDLVPEGKFKYYYRDEKTSVKELRDLTFYLAETSEEELKRIDSLHNAVEQYLKANRVKY